MVTIEYLRSLAELNLCDNCFQKYKALIEPTIKNWLAKPLSDWRQVESYVTQMAMKAKGVFKGKMWVISLNKGEEEKVADYVNVKAFREIEKWGFKRKIDYLHSKGILQDSAYSLMDMARLIRNTIHEDPLIAELSEQDYALFSVASAIASQIWSALMIDWGVAISSNIRSNAEKVAEQWLNQLKRQKISPLIEGSNSLKHEYYL
jgi:hypothetical protein